MKGWVIGALMLVGLPAAADCVDATDTLRSMSRAEVALHGPDGETVTVEVRMADDARKRAAGFQHICPRAIERTAIYFRFARARRPNFHMRNVKAPLDIAFIDGDGLIVDIQRMDPYVLGAAREIYYSPPGPVTAALETRAGYFTDRDISAGDWRVEVRR